MHAAERHYSGDPPAGPDDHLSPDLLAENPVRRADVAKPLRRNRRRLQPQAVLPDRGGGLVDDRVLRRAPRLEGEIEARQIQLDADHVRSDDPERLLEQFLAGLVAFEHHDRVGVHRGRF